VITAAAVMLVLAGALLVPAAPARAQGDTQRVLVTAAHYVPEQVEIAHGDQLELWNIDPLGLGGHSIVDDHLEHPRFGSRVTEPGDTSGVEGVPGLAPGTYHFHCLVHTHIRGTLVVR
jgi:plastocyanin